MVQKLEKKSVKSLFGALERMSSVYTAGQKFTKPGLVQGPWTKDEGKIVSDAVGNNGVGNIKWSVIARQDYPGRLGKSGP